MEGIMVSAATGVMNSLLAKLTTLLLDEYKLQKSVKRDIKFLKFELSSMNALLVRLAEQEELDPQTKEWRNQVREMAYDIEDFIDIYMYRLHCEPEKSTGIKGFFRMNIKKAKSLGARHGMAEQIQELKNQIIEASRRRERYKLDTLAFSGSTDVVAVDPRMHALYVEAASLVGIDGPMEELIKLLDDGDMQQKLVSIVGFGGLGKTTLANQAYQKIGQQFNCKAFVSVSQKPNILKMLQTILSQIGGPKDANIGSDKEEWLINHLRDFLMDKRYLIVIDDIWNTNEWKVIKCILPDNSCGSRIILTTRKDNVAKFACSTCHGLVYNMRPLSEDDSKILFFRRTFGSQDNCPPHLVGVSIEIIRKCGGLPLAVNTMASLLITKSEAREDWISVHNSIGMGLEENPDVEEMNKILSLSYSDLPCHLKTCLLYLCMYPEDYEIEREDLLCRWIAEGFIKVDGRRRLQEVAICYFNELINKSMILPVDVQPCDGQARACRLHDMILDLIVSKAAEENLVTCIGGHKHKLVSEDKVRRLSINYFGQDNVAMPSIDPTHVRALSVYGFCETMPSILGFQALRVLSLEASTKMKMENINLENIGKLFQLRYLRLKGYEFTCVPKEIGKLHFLEVLDVGETKIRELPTSVVELEQLKCLLTDGVKLPVGVGRMQGLEVLVIISVDENTPYESLQELGSLTKLRMLVIFWRISGKDSNVKAKYEEALVSSINELCKSTLRSLGLSTGEKSSLDFLGNSMSPPPHIFDVLRFRTGSFTKIPVWMASLSILTYLHINVDPVTQETLNILGGLASLIHLELDGSDADHNDRLVFGSNRFICLKVFTFGYSEMFKAALVFEEGSMPKLETLDLLVNAKSGASCGSPDLGIHHLLALKDLIVQFHCEDASVEDVKALEAAIKNAASLLPNRPTHKIYKIRPSRWHPATNLEDNGSA